MHHFAADVDPVKATVMYAVQQALALITSETEALLVDTLITYDQVDALADWIKGFGKHLVGVLLTHGHSDHSIGLSRLRWRRSGHSARPAG